MLRSFLLRSINCVAMLTASMLTTSIVQGEETSKLPAVKQVMQSDSPVLWWSFDESDKRSNAVYEQIGGVSLTPTGPTSKDHDGFERENSALSLRGGASYLKVTDPGENSALDFQQGDAITIEAWIKPDTQGSTGYPYVVGKGRTHRNRDSHNNQNYALRLERTGSRWHLSFLFMDGESAGSAVNHRWTSRYGVLADDKWHHVAVSYRFGDPKSIVGFVDGLETSGTWDLGGASTKAPVVDNDDLWIGSSMGGGNSFVGSIDELAIYRQQFDLKDIQKRFRKEPADPAADIEKMITQSQQSAPAGVVHVEIREGLSAGRTWEISPPEVTTTFELPAFGLTALPRKYNPNGIIEDRASPLLLHLNSRMVLPEGELEFMVRSINSARLYIDGKKLVQTPFMGTDGSAHQPFEPLKISEDGELSLPFRHFEEFVDYTSDGQPHVVTLMMTVGYGNRDPHLGELTLAYRQKGEPWQLLTPQTNSIPFTDVAWIDYLEQEQDRLLKLNRQFRDQASAKAQQYWQQRHQVTREIAKSEGYIAEELSKTEPHPIDGYINQKLEQAGMIAGESIDDWAFLRRSSLDVIGVMPTEDLIRQFWADPQQTRREKHINRLLAHHRFTDHQIGYWQDVLAENPGLTKPMLNNSGPFRWYLEEAFDDNRSFDRIVTELLAMEGSRWMGGTAGFGVASNNDVPFAAKAHIIGTAFLGVEMKCARCHDAPNHDVLQQDLFEVAALLNNNALKVPKTSSIDVPPEKLAQMAVEVTLKPGTSVQPNWPFADRIPVELTDVPQFVQQKSKSGRAQLSLHLTWPENQRFTQAVANRVWERLMGRGIVNSLSDWEGVEPSHPELLAHLGWYFVAVGYDLKELMKYIMQSQAYQRVHSLKGQETTPKARELYAVATRRQLSAEQLVDSLYVAAGKEFDTELLYYSFDGRQASQTFCNLGYPKRAWELTATSNERERPSMALPRAQAIVDLMMAYGWRQLRSEPVTEREMTAMPLQPMQLANGVVGNQVVDVSDNGEIVDVALQVDTPKQLVERLFARWLTRQPTPQELQEYVQLLTPGFESRATGDQPYPPTLRRWPVTWSNHFSLEANEFGSAQQELVQYGDQPTGQLTHQWRSRLEDAMWVLANSPEFMMVP